jgi:hypothetical protein
MNVGKHFSADLSAYNEFSNAWLDVFKSSSNSIRNSGKHSAFWQVWTNPWTLVPPQQQEFI